MQSGKPNLEQATSCGVSEGGEGRAIASGSGLLYRMIWVTSDYYLSKQDKWY